MARFWATTVTYVSCRAKRRVDERLIVVRVHRFGTQVSSTLNEGHGFHGTPGQVSRAVEYAIGEGFSVCVRTRWLLARTYPTAGSHADTEAPEVRFFNDSLRISLRPPVPQWLYRPRERWPVSSGKSQETYLRG